MIAMDDFQTFKKIMVKRNTELQMEAMRLLQDAAKREDSTSKDNDDEDAKVASLPSSSSLTSSAPRVDSNALVPLFSEFWNRAF